MMSFYGLVSRCIYINTSSVVYNGWKAGMLYSRHVYSVIGS